MSKGDTFENDLLRLIFNATAIGNIADNAASSPLTNLQVSLHTSDVGEGGSQTANEVDVTKFGDTSRRFRKSLIEQTCELECVDDPGVEAGDTFTLTGTNTGASIVYIVTSVKRDEPIDGIVTYTVSASRAEQ